LAKDGETIHVALAIHDPNGGYSRHSGVVMTSIFERTGSAVCVHILHDETLTEKNRSFLREVAETSAQMIEFHDVSQAIGRMGRDATRSAKEKLSVGALFRLLIPEVVTAEKVIYLDSDIVVNMDIRQLWDIPLGENSVAGALDRGRLRPYGRFSSVALEFALIGCDRKAYINTGVLLLNIARIRERYELIPQSIEWYARHAHITRHVDQDMINSCFRGDIKIIDSKFNNCHSHDGDISDNILHAVGPGKPWNGPKFNALHRLYWKTFLKTPWGRLGPEEVADLMFDVFGRSPLMHAHTRQCYRRIIFRLYKDIVRNEATSITLVLCKELKHRLTSIGGRADAG
jgi:lipopolysaccharide biosynthesis glycosyltransferase